MSDVEIPSGGEAEEISPEAGVADAEAEVQFDPEPEPPQYDFLEVGDEDRAEPNRIDLREYNICSVDPPGRVS